MRSFSAPNSLKFRRCVRRRWLREVQRDRALVAVGDFARGENEAHTTAINDSNYSQLQGRRPDRRTRGPRLRVKRATARRPLQSNIFIDVTTGSLVRAEGEFVKSPSVFIRR